MPFHSSLLREAFILYVGLDVESKHIGSPWATVSASRVPFMAIADTEETKT